MQRLGYTQYVAQGGDWGSLISELMAVHAGPELLGIHTNLPMALPAEIGQALHGGPLPSDLQADEKHALFIKDPEAYGLPANNMTTNYIIAKEDYYFVYPTNYHRYLNPYHDTFQHGGVSMEEMLLPVVTLRPRA